MILGYYLVNLDNVGRSIIIHVAFELSVLLFVVAYNKLIFTKSDPFGDSSLLASYGSYYDFGVPIKLYTTVRKLKRSNSMNDVATQTDGSLNSLFNTIDKDYKLISKNRDEIDTNTLESIDKFNKICNNHRMILK